jgi:hypothetical protein
VALWQTRRMTIRPWRQLAACGVLWFAVLTAASAAAENQQPATSSVASGDSAFLHKLAAKVLDSAKVPAGACIPGGPTNTTGYTLRVPGGTWSYYPAFWVRDAAMMLGGVFVPADEIEGWVRVIAATQPGSDGLRFGRLVIPPFSIPDHITLGGAACWFPGAYTEQGNGTFGFLPPADDAFFFIQMVHEHGRLTGAPALFLSKVKTGWGEVPVSDICAKVFGSVAADAESGLVRCEGGEGRTRVDWGFCDSIRKTGFCLMPSLLRWKAACDLVELFSAAGRSSEADVFRKEAAKIRAAIPFTFSQELSTAGGLKQVLLLSATELGRNDDVWASAYAVWLGVLPEELETAVARHLLTLYEASGIVMEGQVRHLPPTGEFGGFWEQASCAPDTYQNGGYWGTPTGWLVVALRKVSPSAADQLLSEYITHLRTHEKDGAPWEWIQPAKNLRVNALYGSSAGLVVNAIDEKENKEDRRATERDALSVGDKDRPVACVVGGELPGADRELPELLAQAVTDAGYTVTRLPAETLCDAAKFSDTRCDLLVLSDGRALPTASISAVQAYLNGGGRMIACGLPLWDQGVANVAGRWTTRHDREALVAGTWPSHALVDFANEDLRVWRRSSNAEQLPATYEVTAAPDGKALHVIVSDLKGWDNFGREFAAPFPKGHSLTGFRAKGDSRTKNLMIEWQEKDGSRWIATVELMEFWQQYALPPEAFKAWEPRSGRGGAGDHFQPANAQRLMVGVAYSHMPILSRRQEYWIADIGTAPNPLPDLPAAIDVPHIESLCPGYQFFPTTTAARVRPTPSLGGNPEASVPLVADTLGVHPRPGPAGLDKRRPWLRQVLLEAITEQGEYRGAIGTLTIPLQRDKPGGAWVAFTPAEAGFYRQPLIARSLLQAVRALHRGLFLYEAGANYYTALEGQPIRCGAQIVNLASEPATRSSEREFVPTACRLRLTVAGTDQSGLAFDRTWAVAVPARGVTRVAEEWTPSSWPSNGYIVTAELVQNDATIDRVRHSLHCWKPKSKPQFLESRDGGLWLQGRPWKAHGVNYMPSSGVGLANGNLFEFWLGAAAYDPDITRRDLKRIRAMNMNAVSVFSDFGIINPDGTDRPVTRVIRELGPQFLNAPKPLAPDLWITVDRDADARGLPGIYSAVQEQYWRAASQDRRPGLRWAHPPGNKEK